MEEGRGGNDGVGSDTIVAYGQGGDEREIGWFDQGGVALELDELSRANQVNHWPGRVRIVVSIVVSEHGEYLPFLSLAVWVIGIWLFLEIWL